MRLRTALLVAALLVVLAVLVYVVARGGEPLAAKPARRGPWQLYRDTAGGFDGAADRALRAATDHPAPSPADHLLAATVLRRNVLEQTPAAGAPAAPRRAAFDQARAHYAAAVEGVRAAPLAGPPRWLEPRAGFIIDAATDFAFAGILGLLDDDQLAAFLGAEMDAPGLVVWMDRPIAAAAAAGREELVGARRQAAAAAAEGAPSAATDLYLRLATEHGDDPQNVHDPGVLAALRAVVARLRAEQDASALPSLDAVVADLRAVGPALSRDPRTGRARPERVADAVAVAERARAGERAVAIDVTDEEALRRVWARAADPRNAAARGALRQAAFDALVDAWEGPPGSRRVMCVNGRCERQLGSLALLDFDARNWEVETIEGMKNEIFERARAVIDAEASAAAASGDGGERAAGRAYLAATPAELAAAGEAPAADAAALADRMRAAIGRDVDEYAASHPALPAHHVAGFKREAQAAVA